MKKDSTAYAAVRPKWDTSDCCVRALAVACGVSYEAASVAFSAGGRRVGKGTPRDVSAKVYEEWLGMTRLEGVEGMALADFAALAQRGRYVVHKAGHAFAVIEGIVHDWAGTTTKPGTRVQLAWRVTEGARVKMLKVEDMLKSLGN